MYIDSHTHLNSPKLFVDWQKHILDFENIWWKMIINAWSDDEYNENWLIIAKKYNWNSLIKMTAWFHPYEIVSDIINNENMDEKMEELKIKYFENMENRKHIVAVWECWIDVSYDWWRECIILQQKLLKAHCELAREFNLPLVIHSRDDFDSTVDVIKDYKDLKIYFHCRWYGPKEIEILQNNFENIWIWFCANISYPKAQNIRDSLAVVGINNILLETDAPYLPPQEFRGKTNYPIYVKHIYNFVAEQLQIEESKLIETIEINANRLYFWD